MSRATMTALGTLLFAFAAGLAPVRATPAPSADNRKPVQVVFVLDTTGSMGPLIESAKRKVWSIATAILDEYPQADVQMGLVLYRDIGDDYVTKVSPLTKDIQNLYAELLEVKARGGGDWPESVNEALYHAVAKADWDNRPFVDRIVFLVGDAPPHMDYAQDRKYQETLEIARKSGIIVNAVQAGMARDTERYWREIAKLGRGRYMPIPQDGGPVVTITTPFDREILELQIEINRTVLPYGSPEQQGNTRMKAQAPANAPPSVAADMSVFINKSGSGAEAITGAGDLVSDIAKGRTSLGGVRDEELPYVLRKLAPERRAEEIETLRMRRAELQARMNVLVKKRDADVAAQATARPARNDSFDQAVVETLRSQLKK